MTHILHTADGGRGTMADALAYRMERVLDTLAQWRMRALTRRELARLDDRMLADIGISQADVENEASKHFWQS